MEQYDNPVEKGQRSLYGAFDGIRSFLSAFLGVIATILGIGLVFVVASLEGAKEVKASNRIGAILMSQWREESEELYPEHKIDVIKYKDKEYYFVIKEKSEEGEILEWYFAYEAGIDYIFKDLKFYILTGLTIIVSIFVAYINYTSSVNGAMNSINFLKTLKSYQDVKHKTAKNSQYLPDFCIYKNKQLYDEAKRNVIEDANVLYDDYLSKDFDINSLEKWQRKKIKKIRKIKIRRINSSDLLQERNIKLKRLSLLPISPERHKRNYMFRTSFIKILSSVLSGLTVIFGVVLGNWVLGITYGFTVLISFVMSNIAGGDYGNNGLRQRFVAKADLLNEFDNMVDYFIEEKAKKQKQEEVIEVKPIVEEITVEEKPITEEEKVIEEQILNEEEIVEEEKVDEDLSIILI